MDRYFWEQAALRVFNQHAALCEIIDLAEAAPTDSDLFGAALTARDAVWSLYEVVDRRAKLEARCWAAS